MRTVNALVASTNVQIVDKEPQESLKNERKTLQVLQQAAGKDKENLVGAGRSLRSAANNKDGLQIAKEIIEEKQIILNDHLQEKTVAQPSKRQKKMPSSIVKGKSKVKAEDLMCEVPSEKYWSVLAEKRRIALETALEENKALHEKVALLEEENTTTKKLLEETNQVIELLREMVAGDDTDIDMSVDVSASDNVDAATDDNVDASTDDNVDVSTDDNVDVLASDNVCVSTGSIEY